MGFERSDEARREDGLYDRIGRLERTNSAQAKKITELEAENADLKVWRKRSEARAAERRRASWRELVNNADYNM